MQACKYCFLHTKAFMKQNKNKQKKKVQLMSASDGSKNSDESDWGWIKGKKKFKLAWIEKAWAGARNWQCAGDHGTSVLWDH